MRESQFNQKLKKYLDVVVQQGASDLHLSVGFVPIIRVDGKLLKLQNEPLITKDDMELATKVLLNEKRIARLEENKHLDFSIEHESNIRFRANVFYQRGTLSMALRLIPEEIKPLKELNMPEILYEFSNKSQGLLLVTGPMGHGKSTTLASIVDYINHKQQKHIITIEDPIEFAFKSDECLIEQREIYHDVLDFQQALKACFREDADIIFVGEMRDLETISTVMTAAETGHLVLATLHTNDTIQTVDRIIDIFPAYQQNQIRLQLSNVLLGVVSQRLLRKIGGGRIPAVELMIKNKAIENQIRQNQTHQIGVVIETSLDEGMISLNRSLANLVREGQVSLEDAESYATDVNAFRMYLEGVE